MASRICRLSASGHASATLMVFHSVAANNGVGIEAQGMGATLRAAQSMVTGNTNGWLAGGGMLLSAGDNTFEGNTSNEAAPPPYTKK